MAQETLTTPIPTTAQATKFELALFNLDFVDQTVMVQVTFYNIDNRVLETKSFSGTFVQFGIDSTTESNIRTKIRNRLLAVNGIN